MISKLSDNRNGIYSILIANLGFRLTIATFINFGIDEAYCISDGLFKHK